MSTLNDINIINWSDYETAYGKANDVPVHLTLLYSGDKEDAMNATHDLWCGLCHQTAFISSAALPAYDFLRNGLAKLDDDLKIEILDIISGFSTCLTPDYYKSRTTQAESWEEELRKKIFADLDLYLQLSRHDDEQISKLAADIYTDMTLKPPAANSSKP